MRKDEESDRASIMSQGSGRGQGSPSPLKRRQRILVRMVFQRVMYKKKLTSMMTPMMIPKTYIVRRARLLTILPEHDLNMLRTP